VERRLGNNTAIPGSMTSGGSGDGTSNSSNNRSISAAVSNAAGINVNPPMPRYNRRNNPDLEKRRIHHCDYPGT